MQIMLQSRLCDLILLMIPFLCLVICLTLGDTINQNKLLFSSNAQALARKSTAELQTVRKGVLVKKLRKRLKLPKEGTKQAQSRQVINLATGLAQYKNVSDFFSGFVGSLNSTQMNPLR